MKDIFRIRIAKREDTELILELIKALAEYEEMLDLVVATKEQLEENLFDKKQAEVIIGEENGIAVGFALFFHNFSTFLGKANLYLEDLYIKKEYRSKGYGKKLLLELAAIANERDCGRLDWWCLDWNKDAINFYKKLGAIPMDEWTTFRLEKEALEQYKRK